MATTTRNPTSDDAVSGTWTGSAGSRYTVVDDYPDSGGADSLTCSAAGALTHGFSAFSVPTGATSISVQVLYYDQKSGSPSSAIQARLKVGGNYYAGPGGTHNPSNGTWVARSDNWTTNPKTTAAWTVAQVNGTDGTNDLQAFGVDVTDASPNVLVSSVQLQVTFTAPVITKTASLSAAVQIARSVTANLGTAVQAAQSIAASTQAAVRAEITATASTGAAVQIAGVSATASLDAMIAAGTLYYVIYPSAKSAPSAAQIKAGNDVDDGPAAASGSEISPTTSQTYTFASAATGLSEGTSYRIAFVWSDGSDDSNVAVSDPWSTLTNTVVTASLGAVVQIARSAASSLGAAVQATPSVQASIEVAIRQERSATASSDAAIRAERLASASADAAVLHSPAIAASADAAIMLARSIDADLNAAILAVVSASAAMDAAVLHFPTATAQISAYVQAGSIAISELGAAIQIARSATASLGSAIAIANSASASLTTSVQAQRSAVANLDAAVRLERSASQNLGVAISAVVSAEASLSSAIRASQGIAADLSAFIQSGNSVSAILGAAISTSNSAAVQMTAVIAIVASASANLSAAIAVRGVISAAIDAVILRNNAASVSIGCFILDEGLLQISAPVSGQSGRKSNVQAILRGDSVQIRERPSNESRRKR